MKRSIYHISMIFNGQRISEIIIDQHYMIKHPEINDDLIIRLVLELNGERRMPNKVNDPFSYFVEDPISLNGKPYRMIFLTERNQNFIGVINTYRVKERKNGISV